MDLYISQFIPGNLDGQRDLAGLAIIGVHSDVILVDSGCQVSSRAGVDRESKLRARIDRRHAAGCPKVDPRQAAGW